MAQKCFHKGCGQSFTDAEEPCIYHPGPPIFHEGQKGWKCCKPRVLTFDEFLSIPPCTKGRHSAVDDTPAPEPAARPEDLPAPPPPRPIATSDGNTGTARAPRPAPPVAPAPPPPEPESEDDDASLPIPANTTCRRRACGASSSQSTSSSREGEECVHHPGHPIFHEGSKGWTCCKRRVLEFDEFMRIGGCKTRDRHMFVGSGKKDKERKEGRERMLDSVRTDFYQTGTTVHASLYLKKIDKAAASVVFSSASTVELDLPTADNTRYRASVPLYGPVDTEKSTSKIMGTKLDLTLVKADGLSWPVLRADERSTGEIIQVGRAGRA